ncbi:ABC transporter substrate-binding protein [Ruania alba]|uniref:Carbohydrate ABC transporter substrate-binding protein, CUT1 family n=1 Tax=Ruania alba TaxID=648782 RepID=A0A1H5MA39_9MICO|nr:ABC transporter substrate-binding protein [Ruania alba]SEE86162.1 carbohydrate ABC transporter substrate-binding protein, CUT1 family [Ruania alba]
MTRTAHPHSRRAVLTGASVATLALTLAACSGFVNTDDPEPGGSGDGDAAGGTVTAYVSTEQNTGLEPLLEGFTDETGITVDHTSAAVPDLNQQLAVQLGSGTAADVFRVSPGYSSSVAAGALGSSGGLLDLSDQPWVSSIDPGTTALSAVDGVTYGFPVARNSLVMAYNVALFDELGLTPPTTWSELLEVCQELQDAGKTPIAQGLAGGAIYLQFYVYALAGTMIYGPEPDIEERMRAEETSFSEHPEWTEVFEKYLELRDRDFFTADSLGVPPEEALQDVATGEAGMVLLTNSGLPQLVEYAPGGAEDIAIFAMPATDDAEATLLPTAPDFLAVNAEAANPDAARTFLEYLSRPENVETYANTIAALPGLDVGAQSTNEALEPVMPLVDSARTVAYANYLWPNGDVQQTMLQSGAQLYADEITIPDLLEQMDAEHDLGTP